MAQLQMCGGLGATNEADENVQNMVNTLKSDIESKTGKQYDSLKVIGFKSQVVAGTNYFVKVNTGSEHIHLRVFKPLPFQGDQPQLHSVQLNHTADSAIAHF